MNPTENKYIITFAEIPEKYQDEFERFIRGRKCPMEGYWRHDWDEFLYLKFK